eukprot:TRINITY_DN27059_c0_g1_i2.p4 TRINITY_DN27059_c0_g1~~TRINITY_DN27059_c0_g1_i2.p4  ORF type:complete len:215 (-),score=-1.04 TRINITY_DN27059_c0_g1_i2:176-820(-)
MYSAVSTQSTWAVRNPHHTEHNEIDPDNKGKRVDTGGRVEYDDGPKEQGNHPHHRKDEAHHQAFDDGTRDNDLDKTKHKNEEAEQQAGGDDQERGCRDNDNPEQDRYNSHEEDAPPRDTLFLYEQAFDKDEGSHYNDNNPDKFGKEAGRIARKDEQEQAHKGQNQPETDHRRPPERMWFMHSTLSPHFGGVQSFRRICAPVFGPQTAGWFIQEW